VLPPGHAAGAAGSDTLGAGRARTLPGPGLPEEAAGPAYGTTGADHGRPYAYGQSYATGLPLGYAPAYAPGYDPGYAPGWAPALDPMLTEVLPPVPPGQDTGAPYGSVSAPPGGQDPGLPYRDPLTRLPGGGTSTAAPLPPRTPGDPARDTAGKGRDPAGSSADGPSADGHSALQHGVAAGAGGAFAPSRAALACGGALIAAAAGAAVHRAWPRRRADR